MNENTNTDTFETPRLLLTLPDAVAHYAPYLFLTMRRFRYLAQFKHEFGLEKAFVQRAKGCVILVDTAEFDKWLAGPRIRVRRDDGK